MKLLNSFSLFYDASQILKQTKIIKKEYDDSLKVWDNNTNSKLLPLYLNNANIQDDDEDSNNNNDDHSLSKGEGINFVESFTE